MAGYLIKDTTREEREKIVREALGEYDSIGCETSDGFNMYWPYIEGKKELKDINMEYRTSYIKEYDDEQGKGCGMGFRR